MRRGDVTMADVADPNDCVFCGGNKLQHEDLGWHYCEECGATQRYSMRLGEITDAEPPEDLDLVSELLWKLRKGEV